MSNTACRYYTERTLGWMLNNKVIVLLSMLSFCLFVSTLTLAGQKNRALTEVENLKNSLDAIENPTPGPTTNLPIDGGGDGTGDGNGEGNGDGNGNGNGNGNGEGNGDGNGDGNGNADGDGNGDSAGNGNGDGNVDGGNGDGNGDGNADGDGNGDSAGNGNGAGNGDGNGDGGAGAGGNGNGNGDGNTDGNANGNENSEGGGTSVKGDQNVGVRVLRWTENDLAVGESENAQDSLDSSLSNSKLWRSLGGA